jgi:hypothetical protein
VTTGGASITGLWYFALPESTGLSWLLQKWVTGTVERSLW